MKDNNWINKEQRAEVAVLHTKYMDKYYSKQTNESIAKTKIYDSNSFEIKVRQPSTPHGAIVDIDSVGGAFMFEEGKTAILNFASHKNPGGMFIKGSRAQEECLCHESNLYNVLRTFDNTYYEYNRKNLNQALYINRGLYTPDIIFEHNGKVSMFDVITCAAPNKAAAQKYQGVSNEKNSYVLQSRIQFVLDIAEENKVDTLILGAYGCGVFGQDPEEVAAIFKILLPYYNFKKIIFAIPKGNGNFDAFIKIWKQKESQNE